MLTQQARRQDETKEASSFSEFVGAAAQFIAKWLFSLGDVEMCTEGYSKQQKELTSLKFSDQGPGT